MLYIYSSMFHSPDRIIFERDGVSDRFPKSYFYIHQLDISFKVQLTHEALM